AEQVDEPDDWTTPVNEASAPAIRVADKVATAIQRITAADAPDGAVRPGGIMVLVRKRDRFVHALARRLKEMRIPVAGADRLSLSAHIAVQDMMALGRFCLLPEDDLSLAAILRSPIFGLTDQQLFELAADRPPSRSLIASLRAAEGDMFLRQVVEQLDKWATDAAFRRVFEFYSRVLGSDGVRRKMVARLGPDAGDILDEFLNFCLAQERVGLPGLEAFLATLETAAPEIKREMDQTRDEVRIMTVHAAKGMEAPVVFLVDGGQAPFSDQHLPRLIPHDFAFMHGKVRGFLWRAGVDLANTVSRGIAATLKLKAEEEYRRLLYVGMTRAEDRLIVCGYHGKRTPAPGTWHSIVTAALGGAEETETIVDPATGEPTLLFRVTRPAVIEARAAAEPLPEPERVLLPALLERNPPPPEHLPRPLTPSGASLLIEEGNEPVVSERSPVFDATDRAAFAAARGTAVHRLLQVLPSLAQGREAAAARYIQRVGQEWQEPEQRSVLQSVFRILSDPLFAPLFAGGSRAEVEIMGTLTVRDRERAVSGKIDRLAVTPGRVLIADFKTSRPPPTALDQVPPAYVLQLALYRALLQKVYPGRSVEAALIFTETPSLIAVPAEAMDAALARLTRA
ncbi:MAG: 3'-5' exonuclease, partial [Rhizobiaceae bacterium]